MPGNPSEVGFEHALDAWAEAQSGVRLSAEISAGISAGISLDKQRRIRAALAPSLMPVKPLPSQGRLVLRFLAVFAACSGGLIAAMGRAGFHRMTGVQMASMAAILTGAGMLFSLTVAWRMAPGSRQKFALSTVLALLGGGAIGGIAWLFPWHASNRFVSEGWPCAVMELAIAVPGAVVFWLLARRGALFGGAGLGAALSGLAVVLALLVLQFQCMFQQAPHLLAWHGGTAAILIGLGALAGARRSHRSL
jgi:hypothetical protein